MRRIVGSIGRVRHEGFSPTVFRSICIGAVVLLSAIVVTGAAVRLTGSGLGCDDWPNCNGTRFIDVSNQHAAIEQVNRLFTFLVSIGVALAAAAAWLRRPRRRDLTWLGFGMLVGVPAQGLVGAIVVWSELHPATVQLHLLLSMVLVWAAVMMLVRSGDPDEGVRVVAVEPRVRRLVQLLASMTAVVVVAGTVVTGTGPHAGDEEARRFFGTTDDIDGRALQWATRVHGALVWLTVLVALVLLLTLRRRTEDRQRLDAPLTAWIITAALQGTVGYVQYAGGLPVGLVLVHMVGVTVLVGITAWLWWATTAVRPVR